LLPPAAVLLADAFNCAGSSELLVAFKLYRPNAKGPAVEQGLFILGSEKE